MPLVTAKEAAEVLGTGVQHVYNYASQGHITRHSPAHAGGARGYDLDELEAWSLRLLSFSSTGHRYWLNVQEVADYLGVTRSRVRALHDEEKLPFILAPNGRRYTRRHQLEVIANARRAKAGAQADGTAP